MDFIATGDLATSLASAAAFAEQLSNVFNNHALTSRYVSPHVRDHVNVLSATITPLKQVCCLLEDETKNEGKQLFSVEGLLYVSILVRECAAKLAKIAPIVAHAGAKKGRKWNHTNNELKIDIIVRPAELMLDEAKLLKDLESAKWRRVSEHTGSYLDRLGEVQIRLLLVQQIIALGILSKDVSSGKVDIEKIVVQHELIDRTASLAGISQYNHRKLIHRRSLLSHSTVSSGDDSSNSDSDEISIIPLRKPAGPVGPPPPPSFSAPGAPLSLGAPGPPPRSDPPQPPPPGFPPTCGTRLPSYAPPPLQCTMPLLPPTPMVKPPAYEYHTRMNLAQRTSTFHADLIAEKNQDIKQQSEHLTRKIAEKDERKISQEGRLFRSRHNSLSFKIKTLFRSQESLAKEMKAVLEDTQYVLQAFLIEHEDIHPIPHSTFHSLEATHMRDILSQLNGNSWFETYSRLTAYEHDTLDAAIYQDLDPNKSTKREVVVLKLLQENKANAWLRLLTKCLGSEFPFPHHLSGRVVLVILREPLVDGERKMFIPRGFIPDPAGLSNSPPQIKTDIKPAAPTMNKPAAPPSCATGTAPPIYLPPGLPSFTHRGPPPALPPQPNRPCGSGLPMPPPPPSGPHLYHTPLHSAIGPQAMETYHEYTIRVADRGPNEPRSWDHVLITKESNTQTAKFDFINAFARRGDSVIGAQLQLTEHQVKHMSNIIDDLKRCEADNKFEWCWGELSLYDDAGRKCLVGTPSECTKLHLIAMRCLKKEYRPGGLQYRPVNLPPNFGPGPNPYPGYPGPPPLPPMRNMPPPGPPPINLPRNTRRRRSVGTDSSDSDTDYSSDTSHRNSRRRRRRLQESRRSSCSACDDESDEDDPLNIDLKLKRGDDVVKRLLELWTPQ